MYLVIVEEVVLVLVIVHEYHDDMQGIAQIHETMYQYNFDDRYVGKKEGDDNVQKHQSNPDRLHM